jgi:hypothetical protein
MTSRRDWSSVAVKVPVIPETRPLLEGVRVDPSLPKLLKKVFPGTIDYDPSQTSEAIARQAAVVAGMNEVINYLETLAGDT